jgi:cell division protein FtsB
VKDHEIAALVNELRDIAIEFHDQQQLRERIAGTVVPALKRLSTEAQAGRDALDIAWQHGHQAGREKSPTYAENQQLRDEIERLERGEYICKRCGLRKDSDSGEAEF